MTSYGGIIRIRLQPTVNIGYRVEVRLLPLSLLIQAPLYLFHRVLYTNLYKNTIDFSKK